jgi:argininosuccinate synthase
MTRDDEIEYAAAHGIPVPVTLKSPYSVDQNLWGRSIECGVLEDPWQEPPAEVYAWTRGPGDTPAEPSYVEVDFEKGLPVALDGEPLEGVDLIQRLNTLAGQHGVGRVDHIENRLVGIKSREIYEAPAAVALHAAHSDLETLTMTKDAVRFKTLVANQYADLVYNGLWFSALHQDLAAYVASSQRHVTGTVRLRLHRGVCQVVGRKSPVSLYNLELATYDKTDAFDHNAALGFIKLWGLPLKTQAQIQRIGEPPAEVLTIAPPTVEKDTLTLEDRDKLKLSQEDTQFEEE